MNTLTEDRQALRDQIWLAGPEHFDVEHLYTPASAAGKVYSGQELTGEWTACFIGHETLAFGVFHRRHHTFELLGLNVFNAANSDLTSVDGWHMINLDGFNPGKAYDARCADGMDDRTAQWHTAVEWLDRVIKGGE